MIARLMISVRVLALLIVAAAVAAGGVYLYLLGNVDEELRTRLVRKLAERYPDLEISLRLARFHEHEGIELRDLKIGPRGSAAAGAEWLAIDEAFVHSGATLTDLVAGNFSCRGLRLRRATVRATRTAQGTFDVARLLQAAETKGSLPPITVEDSLCELRWQNGNQPATTLFKQINLRLAPAILATDAAPEAQTDLTNVSFSTPSPRSHVRQNVVLAAVPPRSEGSHVRQNVVFAAVPPRSEGSHVRQNVVFAAVPPRSGERGYGERGYNEQSHELETASRRVISCEGSLATEQAPRITLAATFDLDSQKWAARCRAENVFIDDRALVFLPASVNGAALWLRELKGYAHLEVDAHSEPTEGWPFAFTVRGDFQRGELADNRLPLPLTDIAARFTCDNRGLMLDQLWARSGAGQITLSGHRRGYGPTSPASLRGSARKLTLDGRLAPRLAPELQRLYNRFSPEGTLDADFQFTFDGHTWEPRITVDALDLALTYEKFPYRVTGTKGRLVYEHDVLSFQLRTMAGTSSVRLSGEVTQPGPQAVGSISVTTDEPVAIDERLLAALDEQGQHVVRAFHPTGRIGATCQYTLNGQGDLNLEKRVRIDLHDVALRHDRFSYPLQRVTGIAELKNQQWEFRDLAGHNDSGYVVGSGTWHKDALGQGQLRLAFTATDVPLEDELRSALTPEAQKVWASLRPQGTIDHLKIEYAYDGAARKSHVDVRAQKWPPTQNVEGRTISMEPTWFRYRFDQVTGAVRFTDGHLTIEQLRGVHGPALVQVIGDCDVSADGSWEARLEKLAADRLAVDRDLLTALPPALGQAAGRLNLTKPLNLDGKIAFRSSGQPNDPVAAAWDLSLDTEQGSLSCGIRLTNIHGGVRLAGQSVGSQFQCRGELNIDSLLFRDLQFTKVAGPFWVDGQRLLFGAPAEPAQAGKPPRAVTAQLWEGSVSGNAQLDLTGDVPFALSLALENANLTQVGREVMPTAHKLGGRAFAQGELRGTGKGTHTWNGQGAIRLREADIYELPLMVSMLKLLSIRAPDRTAFTTSDIDFRVQGEHLYFDRIDFLGDAVSLKGSGDMGLDRQVNLQFYTLVGNSNQPLAVLQPVLGAASRQVMLIRVAGTAEQPRVTREAFPAINETIQQLFPELAQRPQ